MDRRTVVYYNSRTKRAPVRKQIQRKSLYTRAILAFTFIAFVGVLTFTTRNSSTDDRNASLSIHTQQVASASTIHIESPLQNISLPTVGQTAVGTLDQGLIKKTDNEQQAPIASITKVITALVLLDKKPLQLGEKGEQIVLTEKDMAYFNEYYAKLGTVTAVKVGESMSYYEGLQAMLLPSSNNMSDTLVDYFFDNREDYLAYANKYLQENGLSNTIVDDASGFSPGSKSTPTDLIKLGQLALKHPVVAEIVAQKSATLTVAGDVPNYNQLIREPNIIGIKPGSTDEAGFCLLFAANIPDKSGINHTLVAVTMGHTDRTEFIESLHQLLQESRTVFSMYSSP
jgi:D-alanyl-D-alanine carboxypeptidase (penicillin-binding protein 5/6)